MIQAFFWLVGMLSPRVWAQEDPDTSLQLNLGNQIPDYTDSQAIANFFNSGLRLILAVAAFAAFVAIIYSGVMMITSAGDAAKFATARKNLTWAIIGVVVVSLAYFIVLFVNQFAAGGAAGTP